MRNIPRLLVPVLCILSAQTWAAGGAERELNRSPRGPNPGLDAAVTGLRHGNPGRVLSADQVEQDGRREYRIKILTEGGQVRRFRIDGATGNPLPRPERDGPPPGPPPGAGPGRR